MSNRAAAIRPKRTATKAPTLRALPPPPAWLQAEVDWWFERFARQVRASALGLDRADSLAECGKPKPDAR
jgi:hypothetical protein